jgi:hypothetical protein
MRTETRLLIALALAPALIPLPARAASVPVKVGNGDDGADLEGAVKVSDGPLVQARAKAAALLEKLDTAGVSGLGLLQPEVSRSDIYLAKKDVQARTAEDQGSFHANMRGLVYARTFAEPHAATRFFPAAVKLDEDQLIALHVHEALHRALPPSVREDESIVAAITLAITAPDSTRDQIRRTVAQYVPEEDRRSAQYAAAPVQGGAAAVTEVSAYPIPETARVKNPSTFGYTYRRFREQNTEPGTGSPVQAIHSFHTFMYPFGNDSHPFGMGIEASMVSTAERTEPGPLSLSARLRLWSGRGFDVGAWGVASLNTLSADELKSSPLGRDVSTIGLSMRKDLSLAYCENFASVTLGSSTKEKLGLQEYTHDFGNIVNVSSHVGASLARLRAGVFGEVFLADYHRVHGGEYSLDTGRNRIFSGGPEVTWSEPNFAATVSGRFILNSTRNVSFDELGNIMGQGTGQGSLAATLSVFF